MEEFRNVKTKTQLKKLIIKRYGNKWKQNMSEINELMLCPIFYKTDKLNWICKGDSCYICCERYINIIMEKQLRKGNTLW